MNNLITPDFIKAIEDYSLLLEKDYPQKIILKMTGDRYRLNKTQRIILYRGIISKTQAKQRKNKKVENLFYTNLYLDTYNVLFTLSNYLLGRIVFISNDDFLRDAGEIHGKIQTEKVFFRSIEILFEYLNNIKLRSLIFFIDYPLAYSDLLASLINDKLKFYNLKGEAISVKSPDHELTGIREGIISTSDSTIIDNADTKTFDMARQVLESKFKTDFLNFGEFLKQ